MGLDQWAYYRDADQDGGVDGENNITICDWRKHNRLHGWMEQLYVNKGNELVDEGFGSDFNCVELEVTESDLEQLEAHVEGKDLPETGGFFFGDDSYSYEDEDSNFTGGYFHKSIDLEFIEKGREAIADGKKVYYNSWW